LLFAEDPVWVRQESRSKLPAVQGAGCISAADGVAALEAGPDNSLEQCQWLSQLLASFFHIFPEYFRIAIFQYFDIHVETDHDRSKSPLGRSALGTWRNPGGATVMRPVRALSVGPSVDATGCGKTQSIPQGLAGNGWCSQHAQFRIGLPKYTSSNLMFHVFLNIQ
jgi:hypothetical protein